MGGHINRPRDREHAPTNSGSLLKPERVNVRCTTEQCGMFYDDIRVARQFWIASHPNAPKEELDMSSLEHRVVHATFRKVVRGYLCGSVAEKALCATYLEEFVRKDDYLSKRRQFTQQVFDI